MVTTRTDIAFDSSGTQCRGWLYVPAADSGAPPEKAPIIVMAHGLGAIKEMGLDKYAERFADAGYRVVVFDYRHFGASDGEPRQLLSVPRQRHDWHAAIAFARSLPGGATAGVGLFGTSFSGGHVIAVAAKDPELRAVVAQCPFTSGLASSMTLGGGLPGVAVRGIKDAAAGLLRRPRVTVPLGGKPGEAALMNAADVEEGYLGLMPADVEFTNAVLGAIALTIPLTNPGLAAARVQAPLLVCVCDKDTVAPPKITAKLVARAPRVEINHYPVGHFDIYRGEPFEIAVRDQVAFFVEHLPVGR